MSSYRKSRWKIPVIFGVALALMLGCARRAELATLEHSAKEWPFGAWESARAYTYNFVPMNSHDQMSVFVDTRRNPKIRSEHELSHAQAVALLNRVRELRGTLMVSKCPFPRHAVVFFSDMSEPVGEVDVCFECGDVIAWPDYPLSFEERYRTDPESGELAAWPAYDALVSYFSQLFGTFGEPTDWKEQ